MKCDQRILISRRSTIKERALDDEDEGDEADVRETGM